MYCEHCGAKLSENARFCPTCGSATSEQPPADGQESASASGATSCSQEDTPRKAIGKPAVIAVSAVAFALIAGGVAFGAVATLKFGYYSIGFVLIPLAIILCLQIAVDCRKCKDEK